MTVASESPPVADGKLQGSGIPEAQSRTLPRFTAIDLQCAAHVVVTFAEERHVKVNADDNVLDLIDTSVEARTLYIRVREPFDSSTPVTVQLSLDHLKSVRTTGGGTVDIRHPEGNALDLHLRGDGAVRAYGDGQIGHLTAEVTGAGAIQVGPVTVRSADLTVRGSGRIEAKVRERVSASVVGSGQIRVLGNPSLRKQDLKGSGKISFG